MSISERLPINGTYNFRDVGGYPAVDGRIRPGKLLRSDGLHLLGDVGRQQLRELGIGVVVDLRDDFEARVMPDDLAGLDVDVLRLPVFEGSGASQGTGTVTLPDLYKKIVVQHSVVVVAALREIATSGDTPVLVHCTAGKDRTGIIVALALLAVGVDHQIVIADYVRSEANLSGEWLEGMLRMIGEHGVPETPELRVLMGGSPAEALAVTIDLIEERFGSVREYLQQSGLSLAELQRLAEVLVDRD